MGSQGGGGGGTSETADGGNGKASRQNSLYGLTMDEVQNQLTNLGMPLGSMNLDELLKSIWIANPGHSAGVAVENAMLGNQSTLQHQPSMSLARALSKKKSKERQPTLGEMALEDFLVTAGVFIGSAYDKRTIDVINSSTATQISLLGQWIKYSQPPYAHPQHGMSMMPVYMQAQTSSQPLQTCAGPMIDLPFADNHLALPSPLTEAFSDMYPSGRKRGIPDDVLDKSIERKQK